MKKLMFVLAAALMAGTVLAADGEGPRKGPGDRGPGRRPMAERGEMGAAMMGGDPLVWAIQNPRLAEKLALTDEQKTKLKALDGDKKASRELQEKVRKGVQRQMELLKAEKVDEAAVMAAIDEVFEARKAIAKDQTKRLIAIRSVLTPEQIEKAREGMSELRGQRGSRGPREGAGPREGGRRRGPRDGETPAAKPEA